MKAVVYYQYGPADVLTVEDIKRPEPGKNEVLIKVAACSLNPRDAALRRGDLKWLSGRNFPKLTFADFSGTVVSVGEGVQDFHAGEGVFGYIQSVQKGCSAAFIKVPQRWIAKKIDAMPHAVAAAIPCAYLTALQALRNKANIKEGSKLLIYGASGGVGTAAIQLAKYFKAHVTAVCSTKKNEYCKLQGADEVWSYEEEDIVQRNEKFDVIFQIFSTNGLCYSRMKRLLRREGCYLTLIPSPAAFFASLKNKLTGQPSIRPVLVNVNRDDLDLLAFLLKEGKIKPHISRTFHLHEVVHAHRMIEANHTQGKMVMMFDE